MPRRAMVCEKVFQEEGIFADVTLSEYPLDFIPFDSDILSLELDTAYKVNHALKPSDPSMSCTPIKHPPQQPGVLLLRDTCGANGLFCA